MIITGYRFKGRTLAEIEDKFTGINQKLERISSELYHKKLGEEIAFLTDCISLNVLKRDEGVSIYDSAVNNVAQMIRIAGITNAPVDYDLSIYGQVMQLDDYVYIKVMTNNPKLLKAFNKLEDYSLDEKEAQDSKNAKSATWQKLHGIYETMDPLPLSANLTRSITPDKSKITYPSLNERCENHARHKVQNQLLNQLSGGEQISPVRLMPYLDEVLEVIGTNKDVQSQIKTETANLKQILIDLRKDDSVVFGTKSSDLVEDIIEDAIDEIVELAGCEDCD